MKSSQVTRAKNADSNNEKAIKKFKDSRVIPSGFRRMKICCWK
jgi:hypothetical protein